MELIYERGTHEFRPQWPSVEEELELVQPLPGIGDWGAPYLFLDPRSMRDELIAAKTNGEPTGGKETIEPRVLHDNPAGRVRAMDGAGVDLQLLNPAGSLNACASLPSNIAVGLLGAYNAYLLTYCGAAPSRLQGIIQVHGAEPVWSAREIYDNAQSPAVAGVTVYLPVKISPNDRNFAPIWEALEQTDLPLVHRPSAVTRVWSAQRMLTYLVVSGLFDRYRNLRVLFVRHGASWLGAWLPRLRANSVGVRTLQTVLDEGRVLAACCGAEAEEGLTRTIGEAGSQSVCWESAFPLMTGSYRELAAASRGGLSSISLSNNAARLLKPRRALDSSGT
jgi:predicted TIM-barrel fold metal-dependent hydrolase